MHESPYLSLVNLQFGNVKDRLELAMKEHTQLPAGLPSEIWHQILSILDHADRSSLKSVVLCSSDMYQLAAPILFRNVYVRCDGSPSSYDSVWEKERVYPTYFCIYVKAIIMIRPSRSFPGLNYTHFPPAFMERLFHLFKMAENLQDFSWWHEKYMPGVILYQLHRYRPQVRVHIASSKATVSTRINRKPTSTPHLSCIRSIEAEWCRAEYDEPLKPNSAAHYPAQLKEIICRCENLESLALVSRSKYRVNLGEVSPYMKRKEAEAYTNERGLITLEEGDNLPRIKNLHLNHMRFGPVQSELWATQLQWQNIKRLSLIEVDWTLLLPKLTKEGCFPTLETLEASIPVENSYYRNHHINLGCINLLHAFLGKIPPLKMFVGYGLPQETLSVLAAYHSKSLTDLRFRSKNCSSMGVPHFRASIDDLDNLFTQFPSLHSLGLQVNWTADEELPYDLIANIVLQTHIRHLEINLPDLARYHAKSWPYPGATENACQALVQSLDQISTELCSVHVIISDWYPFRYQPILRRAPETFLIGERDFAGCMRFQRFRQFLNGGQLMNEDDTLPQVPPWVLRGGWPGDLRQDIEGRMSDMFRGKMTMKA